MGVPSRYRLQEQHVPQDREANLFFWVGLGFVAIELYKEREWRCEEGVRRQLR